jgi:hypothetical protein
VMTGRLLEIATEALAAEAHEAGIAGEAGYMARVFAQVSLPHSRPTAAEYVRHNGVLTLSVSAPTSIGLPYGGTPRLLLAWVTSEAVRTRSPVLILGDHLAGFMHRLNLVPTGGRWGSIPRLRDQMQRLFSSSISCTFTEPSRWLRTSFHVADRTELWWDPASPRQAALWKSTVTLSAPFFEEIIRRPVPVDLSVLRELRRSPLALDIYVWLTHRMSYLRHPTTVPWEALAVQFGADYARIRDFRASAVSALDKVLRAYTHVRVEATPTGLRLYPSPTDIKRLA